MTAIIVDSDSAVRADGPVIAAYVLDSALGRNYTGPSFRTWSGLAGADGDWSIASNRVTCGGSLAQHVIGPSGPEEAEDGDQFSECRVYGNYIGPALLWTPGAWYDLRRVDGACVLVDSGATGLATGTSTITDGMVLTLAWAVATHTFYALVNGVLEFSVVNSAHTTGRMGVYSSGGGGAFNNYKFGTGIPDAALGTGSTITSRRTMSRAFGRALNRGFGEET